MENILSVVVLLLIAGLFIFLAIRAGRARRAWLKWPGMLLAGLLGLLMLAVSGMTIYGFYLLNVPPYTYTVADVKVAGTPEQIKRGEQLAIICADCHSTQKALPLDGSADNMVAGGPPIGMLYAPNLTPGGSIKDWSDGEILRALREGIHKSGRPLLGMTSEPFSHLSDDDAQAIVAYLRAQPAVVRNLPETKLNALAALLVGAGLAPTSAQPPITAVVITPAPGTPDYGRYLVYTSGCRDCHGPDLAGTTNPFVPHGPNLTSTMAAWNEAQFLALMQTGVNNTGREVESASMPWKTFRQVFSEADMRDIYNYLKSLPPLASVQ